MKKEKIKEEKVIDDKMSSNLQEPSLGYGVFFQPTKGSLYTYKDYLTWADGKLRELYNGMVMTLSAPSSRHALVTSTILSNISWFIKKRKGKCKVVHAPFDVRFPKEGQTADDQITTVFQPDICVICDLSKIDERGCLGAPDLIVEVQSPSTAKFDMDQKFHVYESSGVKEYWVAFPKEKAITVFILQENGRYDDGTAYEYDVKIPVHIFQGLEIDLKDLFED